LISTPDFLTVNALIPEKFGLELKTQVRRDRFRREMRHPLSIIKFNKEQVIAILKEAEAGKATDDLCRGHGITRGSLRELESLPGPDWSTRSRR
jgi:Transposase